MSRRVFAQTATVDHGKGEVRIDGVLLPWWIEGEGPTITKMDDVPVLVINVPILIESAATEITGHGQRGVVWDPVLGNVGEWAKRFVREQFRATYPDLEVDG